MPSDADNARPPARNWLFYPDRRPTPRQEFLPLGSVCLRSIPRQPLPGANSGAATRRTAYHGQPESAVRFLQPLTWFKPAKHVGAQHAAPNPPRRNLSISSSTFVRSRAFPTFPILSSLYGYHPPSPALYDKFLRPQ